MRRSRPPPTLACGAQLRPIKLGSCVAATRGPDQRLRRSDRPGLVDLDGLAAVEQVGALHIEANPGLTCVAGLAGVQSIAAGGFVINNPLLPTADVEALLAQIPGGDAVLVCGNLDGEPC